MTKKSNGYGIGCFIVESKSMKERIIWCVAVTSLFTGSFNSVAQAALNETDQVAFSRRRGTEALAKTAASRSSFQSRLIEVGEDVLVTDEKSPGPITEPQLVADLKNPKHLLAGAILLNSQTALSDSDCGAFTSFDGGRSWLQHNFGLKGCFDPWVSLRADGVALFTALTGPGTIVIFRSENGGRTWGSAPLAHPLGNGHDDGCQPQR